MSEHIRFRPSQSFVARLSARWLPALALGGLCLWPGLAAAQTPGHSVTTVDEAQAAFASTGYKVDSIQNWSWTSPSVRSFEVHDPSSQRVLMVLVFPTPGEANLLRGEMALHQESSTSTPYMLAGYGPSLWSGNVAIMESTETQLELINELQADQDNGIAVAPELVLDARAPNIPVDVDFQEALQKTSVNL